MAATNGQPNLDLSEQLLSQGPQFDFFQAVRLLHRHAQGESAIRVRPELSLGFPASDIAKIEERPGGEGFLITATFLGLYGVSSPLPAFYTEDLFRDAREESMGARDFLDLLHQRLFALLISGWKKYRLFFELSEAKNPAPMEMLYAISGLSSADATPWVRYSGLLGRRPRSALGLQTLLTDFLGGVDVEIIPFVPRQVKIPLDQQFQLGTGQNILGENSFIGEQFTDVQGKFRVRIGPLDSQRFRSLMREGSEHPALVELITHYLTDPLEYDIELILKGAETEPARLGGSHWSRLGLDMVLLAGQHPGNLSVIFQ